MYPQQGGAEFEISVRQRAHGKWEKRGSPMGDPDGEVRDSFEARQELEGIGQLHSLLTIVPILGREYIAVGLGNEATVNNLGVVKDGDLVEMQKPSEKKDHAAIDTAEIEKLVKRGETAAGKSEIAKSEVIILANQIKIDEEMRARKQKWLKKHEKKVAKRQGQIKRKEAKEAKKLEIDNNRKVVRKIKQELIRVEERIDNRIDNVKTVVGPQGPVGGIGPEGKIGPAGLAGKDGAPGKDATGRPGESAFELARKNGYRGTEADWITSLKGRDGSPGAHGTDGLSTFELARRHGYPGTEREWILRGGRLRPTNFRERVTIWRNTTVENPVGPILGLVGAILGGIALFVALDNRLPDTIVFDKGVVEHITVVTPTPTPLSPIATSTPIIGGGA